MRPQTYVSGTIIFFHLYVWFKYQVHKTSIIQITHDHWISWHERGEKHVFSGDRNENVTAHDCNWPFTVIMETVCEMSVLHHYLGLYASNNVFCYGSDFYPLHKTIPFLNTYIIMKILCRSSFFVITLSTFSKLLLGVKCIELDLWF